MSRVQPMTVQPGCQYKVLIFLFVPVCVPGHSAVGEAYLLAKGSPHANAGEWTKVCQLLAAPLPGGCHCQA